MTYTNITAGGNAGSFNEDVVLTTTFLGNATECANQGTMIGETTEVRVQDAADQGVSESAPDFKVALIYPRATLQFLDVTSRGTPSFQVCLGATLLATPDTAQGVWLAKTTADGSTLAPASGPAGPTIGGTYWGWAPDCAAVSGRDENPCIVVRTKDASVLASALGISANDVKQLPYKSGDLAVVVSKPWPWDGKMGMK